MLVVVYARGEREGRGVPAVVEGAAQWHGAGRGEAAVHGAPAAGDAPEAVAAYETQVQSPF